MDSFQPGACRSPASAIKRRCAVKTLAEQQADLPDWRLDHLARLTDSTGMFQHATYTIPNFAEGYCTDDNARALLLMVLLEQSHRELARSGSGSRPPTRRSSSPPSTATAAVFGTSWASTAAGWRRPARRTATGAASGHWAPASARSQAPHLPDWAAALLRAGPAGVLEHDLAPNLGLRPARHPGVPRRLGGDRPSPP